jgi:hypothetical protein
MTGLSRAFVVTLVCAMISLPASAAEPGTSVSEAPAFGEWLSLGAVVSLYTVVGAWAYLAWYDGAPEHGFEFNEDGWFGRDTYAGGADKLGHLWANLALTRLSADVLEAGGWSPGQSGWLSAGVTTIFFTLVEVKDAYYYAFSFGDMAANLGGAGLALAMRSWPALDETIDLRVSYWPSPAYRAAGGLNFAEDYSGQTYLLALHLKAVTPSEGWVAILGRHLDLTLGYRALDFKPDRAPAVRYVPRRQLGLGVTLNLGQILDDLVYTPAPQKGWGRFSMSATGQVTEHVNPPWTVVPIVGIEDDR